MNEIQLQTMPPEPGLTVYATISSPSGQFYNSNTNALEGFNASHFPAYAVALNEAGTTGFYGGDFPNVPVNGTYGLTIYQRLAAQPDDADRVLGFGEVVWPVETDTAGAGALVSPAYVRRHFPQFNATDDTLLQEWIDAAGSAVKRFCGRDFIPTAYTETFDLDAYSYTLTLNNYPVIGVVAATTFPSYPDQGETIAGVDIIASRTGTISRKSAGFGGWEDECYGRYFPGGFQSVRVSYTAGFSIIPADVRQATAMVVKRLSEAGQVSGLYLTEQLADYKYQLRGDATEAIGADVQSLLKPYRINRI